MAKKKPSSYFENLGNLINKNSSQFNFPQMMRAALSSAFTVKADTDEEDGKYAARKSFIVGETEGSKSILNMRDYSFGTVIGARVLNILAWPYFIIRALHTAIDWSIDNIGTRLRGKTPEDPPNFATKAAKVFFTWVVPPIAEVELLAYGVKRASDVVIDGSINLGKKIAKWFEKSESPKRKTSASSNDDTSYNNENEAGQNSNMQIRDKLAGFRVSQAGESARQSDPEPGSPSTRNDSERRYSIAKLFGMKFKQEAQEVELQEVKEDMNTLKKDDNSPQKKM